MHKARALLKSIRAFVGEDEMIMNKLAQADFACRLHCRECCVTGLMCACLLVCKRTHKR